MTKFYKNCRFFATTEPLSHTATAQSRSFFTCSSFSKKKSCSGSTTLLVILLFARIHMRILHKVSFHSASILKSFTLLSRGGIRRKNSGTTASRVCCQARLFPLVSATHQVTRRLRPANFPFCRLCLLLPQKRWLLSGVWIRSNS